MANLGQNELIKALFGQVWFCLVLDFPAQLYSVFIVLLLYNTFYFKGREKVGFSCSATLFMFAQLSWWIT